MKLADKSGRRWSWKRPREGSGKGSRLAALAKWPIDRERRRNRCASGYSDELVVLLHGFGARPLLMRQLERRLIAHRYDVLNWGYPSTRRSIGEHSVALQQAVTRRRLESSYEAVHFVGYSMGGIVARHAIASPGDLPAGRVVLLAAPNRGTHVARRAARVFGRLCPALWELSDRGTRNGTDTEIPVDWQVGVIAAANDWVVPLDSTRLDIEHDHIVLPGDHLRLPLLPETSRQVIAFLQAGQFSRRPVDRPAIIPIRVQPERLQTSLCSKTADQSKSQR